MYAVLLVLMASPVMAQVTEAPVRLNMEFRFNFTQHDPFVKSLEVQDLALGADSDNTTVFEGRDSISFDPSLALTLKVYRLFLAAGATRPFGFLHTMDNLSFINSHRSLKWGIEETVRPGPFFEAGASLSDKYLLVVGYNEAPYQLKFAGGKMEYGCDFCGNRTERFDVSRRVQIAESTLKRLYASLRIDFGRAGFTILASRTENPFTTNSLPFSGTEIIIQPDTSERWGFNATFFLKLKKTR